MKTNSILRKLSIVFILNIILTTTYQHAFAEENKLKITDIDVKDETCYQSNDVQLTIHATGGTGAYNYSVDGGSTYSSNNVFSYLKGGETYHIVVKDASGNTAEKWKSVGAVWNPINLRIDYVRNASSANAADGKINSGATGGNGNFSFSIDNGASFQPSGTFDKLTPGYYTIIAKDKNGCSAVYQDVKVGPVGENPTFIWLGNNTNWNNASNWNKGTVPGANNVVRIPATNNNPVISTTASASNITIQNGASLKITGILNLSGAMTSTQNGVVDAGQGTIQFIGTAAQNLTSGIFINYAVKNVVIGNVVNLTDSLNVFGNITFSGSNFIFNTNDLLTLKSNAEGTASVGQVMNGNQITGNVTVEQYFPALKGWKFLSVSTESAQTIHDAWQEGQQTGNTTGIHGYGTQLTNSMSDWAAQGFDSYSPSPSIKTYNVATGLWKRLPSTLAPFNEPTNAYMVFLRGDRSANQVASPVTSTTLRSKGELKHGDQAVVNVPAASFTAIGNPYPSAIDMTKIQTSSNMFFYVWDPNLGDSYGAYQTFTKIGSHFVAVPGGGTYSTLSQDLIPAGQAFFVFNENGGTVQLTEASRAAVGNGGGNARRMSGETADNDDLLNIQLLKVNADQTTTLVDGILQGFGASFSNGIDGADALKSSNSVENLSVKRDGKLLAIETRLLNAGGDTTRLNMAGMSYATYRFKLRYDQANEMREVILKDKFTGTQTTVKINNETTYEFQVSSNKSTYAADRFEIIFTPFRVMPVTFTSIRAEKQQQNVQVSWTTENEVNVSEYIVERSSDGNQFEQVGKVGAAQKSGYWFTDKSPVNGINYYRIMSKDIDGKTAYTQIVKVAVSGQVSDAAVYPNPIVGNDIHLSLKNLASGIYYISVRNQMGQVIHQQQIESNGGTGNYLIQPSQKLVPGVYTIELAHPDGSHSVIRFVK